MSLSVENGLFFFKRKGSSKMVKQTQIKNVEMCMVARSVWLAAKKQWPKYHSNQRNVIIWFSHLTRAQRQKENATNEWFLLWFAICWLCLCFFCCIFWPLHRNIGHGKQSDYELLFFSHGIDSLAIVSSLLAFFSRLLLFFLTFCRLCGVLFERKFE